MEREEWSFHNDIATPIQDEATSVFKHLNKNDSLIYRYTIFSADNIEGNSFADVLIILLLEKLNNNEMVDVEIYYSFIKQLNNYSNQSLAEIGRDKVMDLYKEFNYLYNDNDGEEIDDITTILNVN